MAERQWSASALFGEPSNETAIIQRAKELKSQGESWISSIARALVNRAAEDKIRLLLDDKRDGYEQRMEMLKGYTSILEILDIASEFSQRINSPCEYGEDQQHLRTLVEMVPDSPAGITQLTLNLWEYILAGARRDLTKSRIRELVQTQLIKGLSNLEGQTSDGPNSWVIGSTLALQDYQRIAAQLTPKMYSSELIFHS